MNKKMCAVPYRAQFLAFFAECPAHVYNNSNGGLLSGFMWSVVHEIWIIVMICVAVYVYSLPFDMNSEGLYRCFIGL